MLQNGIKRNERFTFAILWHKRYFMAELSDNFNWEIVQLSYIERFKENAVKEKKAYCKRRVQLTPTRLAWYTNIMPTSGHVKTVYVLVASFLVEYFLFFFYWRLDGSKVLSKIIILLHSRSKCSKLWYDFQIVCWANFLLGTVRESNKIKGENRSSPWKPTLYRPLTDAMDA